MMRKFIRIVFVVMACAVPMSIGAQTRNADYEAYIAKYAAEAQRQMKQHGVPASITLAQGLLESAAGKSELAVKANNHFGIKCAGDWTGKTYKHDDETKNECFRKYDKATDSFNDHSLFLKRKRYEPLFELKTTDYKGWAKGLKQCGYATDPAYPQKLIKLIEDYGLAKYDTGNVTTTVGEQKVKTKTDKKKVSHGSHGKHYSHEKEIATKPKVVPPVVVPTEETEMETPTEAAPIPEQIAMPAVTLGGEHIQYRCNGSKYVIAQNGDTFESIAREFNMYEKMLRKYNDIINPRYELQEGDKVYLQLKRKKAEKKYAIYRVRRGENIWQIAQDKGMQLKTIYRLNGIEEGQNVMINQELMLR